MSLLELFCAVDGFCIQYDRWLTQQTLGTSKASRDPNPTRCYRIGGTSLVQTSQVSETCEVSPKRGYTGLDLEAAHP